MASQMGSMAWSLLKRQTSDADTEGPEVTEAEMSTSRSLLILILLLIIALFTSYTLQTRRIQAVHETVISIFAGMIVGLILRLTATNSVLNIVSFDYQFFFNLLLPPIILASGYELHQGNFFRHIGTILTFAFVGTFISAIVVGVIIYVWALLPLESMELSFVEAISVGATLSATDPVTILAIFNTYKVDPHLYTVIFGESILNDAVAIVLFETARRYAPHMQKDEEARDESSTQTLTIFSLFTAFGLFLLIFFGSLVVGLGIGMGTSLMLKFTHIRRFPKIESCIILLIAYVSYFFANAVHLSGIVSLLFCGICLKHYAYHNMSRRTQLASKFIFQILAQLSENFIFIYLGLYLFADRDGLDYRPLFIIVTVIAICVARGLAVFPLSKVINWFIRYAARRRGVQSVEELSFEHQAMLFWAGLRGAVGVALAAGITGENSVVLKATVLVVVVLTVIIFGGTTSRMLEILGIRTGVVEEVDSDDEFDIEIVPHGSHYRGKNNQSFGHTPKPSGNGAIPLGGHRTTRQFSTGSVHGSQNGEPGRTASLRTYSSPDTTDPQFIQNSGLLSGIDSGDDEGAELDLPPSAGRPGAPTTRPSDPARTASAPPTSLSHGGQQSESQNASARGAGGLRSFLYASTQDPGRWFQNLDEGFIKPRLLLDPKDGSSSSHQHGPGNV